ncbi:MAG: type II TA system antitoxin MqsA family protein [Chlamydiota bacterium]
MKCFQCSADKFELQNRRFTPSIKNTVVEVVLCAHICKKCGTPLLTEEHVNNLRRLAADKYREKRKLLTSQEIINFRNQFDMSQKAFSAYLDVGEASLKRWETYYIQDNSQDDHIRIKCDPLYAEYNLLRILEKNSKPDIYNGMKNFSFELFQQIILFFLKNTQANNELLFRLQFYADFLNFKKTRKSITGNRYLPLKLGPYPERFHLMFKILERQNKIKPINEDKCKTEEEPNMSMFDDSEKNILGYICDCCNKNKKCLIQLSQKETAFTLANSYGYINYNHAENLLI